MNILEQGFSFLRITSEEEKKNVRESIIETEEQRVWQEKILWRKTFENRFVIPVGKDKKFYQKLLDATKKKIKELAVHARTCTEYCFIPEDEQQNYMEKRDRLSAIVNTKYVREGMDVTRAKAFPIDQMIQFKEGFAKCLVDTDEKTGSMKYNKGTNTVYCFGCSQKWDAIDVYMKLHNVPFKEAIKSLTCA